MYAQLCLTVCNPMDHGLPVSSVHEISQEEYFSKLPFPSPGYLPNRGIEPSANPALAGGFFTTATWKARNTGLDNPE